MFAVSRKGHRPEPLSQDYLNVEITNESYGPNGYSIGNLYVRPFTSLVGPSDAPNVEVNVYAYSEDIEFASPMRIQDKNGAISAQSLQILAESQETSTGGVQKVTNGINRTSDTYTHLNDATLDNSNVYLYHFGEKVESFRSLLKRGQRCLMRTVACTDDHIEYRTPIYPPAHEIHYPTYSGSIEALSDTDYSYNNVSNIFTSLRYAFLFAKGGYRHRVTLESTNGANDWMANAWLTFGRANSKFGSKVDSVSTFTSIQGYNGTVVRKSIEGVVDVEIPYTSQNLYELICKSSPESDIDDFFNSMFNVYVPNLRIQFQGVEDGGTYLLTDYMSAGEDFTFFRFQGAPWTKWAYPYV
jgi:hypothetical protein